MSLPPRGTPGPPPVHELLDKLTKAQKDIQQQLVDLQQAVTEAHADATKKVVQKLEEEKGFQFRRNGNKKQFHFNQIIAALQHTERWTYKSWYKNCAPSNSQAPGLHAREPDKGAKEIAACQKKIRIADLSWAIIEAHKSDELADD